MYGADNRPDRAQALRRYTAGSACFSNEEDRKGALTQGQFANFAALSDDPVTITESEIKYPHSVPTVVNGRVAHAVEESSARAARSADQSVMVAGWGVRRLQPLHAKRGWLREPLRHSRACAWHGMAWSRNVPVSDASGCWAHWAAVALHSERHSPRSGLANV
jgi:hypothetical protein